VDVTINQGVSISGSGLDFGTTTALNETVTNNGSVTKTTIQAGAALRFQNSGSGTITYTGNGSVSSTTNGIGLQLAAGTVQIGTAATPVVPNFSGTVDGLDVTGHLTVYLNGGTIKGGIQLVETGSNLAPISLTGHTTINNPGAFAVGIFTIGSVAINSDANIGTANSRVGYGIDTIPAPGPLSVTHGVGGNIFASTVGIQAATAGASSNVDVTNNGTISVAGGFGIVAAVQSGSGNVTVHHNGTITTSPGTSTETGIAAGTLGNAPGNVTVSVNGNISTSSAPTSTGILATAANGNVLIDIGSGATVSAGSIGVTAAAVGGTTTINVLGTVSGQFAAARYAGVMNVGNGGTTGTIIGDVYVGGTLNFNRSDAVTYGGVISNQINPGRVQQNGTGSLTLTGANFYTGGTNVNAGALIVNGSIAWSSLTTVNTGATLGGNGVIGNTMINGGTLAPGNSIGLLTVQGSLAFTSAASYLLEVSPVNADRVNVTGSANLGGATVRATFAAGSYVARQYTILNAAGGLGGSTFSTLVNTNLPSGFSATTPTTPI
jgi:autotransporter-associated beta strand protein